MNNARKRITHWCREVENLWWEVGEPTLEEFIRVIPRALGILMALLVAAFLFVYVRDYVDQTYFPKHYYESQGKKVFSEQQPHDCEFDSVPYGNKHCHYERIVVEDENQKTVFISWKRMED